uniref:Uncharacterized protein n=1 Tax=Oryza nivara TaxID=4536 RepID=A0A679BBT2_ORYNI|nr:hypothetical protein [Oryza sativa f. spontanea]
MKNWADRAGYWFGRTLAEPNQPTIWHVFLPMDLQLSEIPTLSRLLAWLDISSSMWRARVIAWEEEEEEEMGRAGLLG